MREERLTFILKTLLFSVAALDSWAKQMHNLLRGIITHRQRQLPSPKIAISAYVGVAALCTGSR